jgi:hypothetical protein
MSDASFDIVPPKFLIESDARIQMIDQRIRRFRKSTAPKFRHTLKTNL